VYLSLHKSGMHTSTLSIGISVIDFFYLSWEVQTESMAIGQDQRPKIAETMAMAMAN